MNPVQFCFSLVDRIHLLANEHHFHVDGQLIHLIRFYKLFEFRQGKTSRLTRFDVQEKDNRIFGIVPIVIFATAYIVLKEAFFLIKANSVAR